MAAGQVERMTNGVEPYASLSTSPIFSASHCTNHPIASLPRSSMAIDAARTSSLVPVVSSRAGMIHVYGYTPAEGEQHVPITVHINFLSKTSDAVYVRLVVGRKAVATHVRQLANPALGRWQLEAAAPPFDWQNSGSTKVSLAVQALDERNSILDSVTFGEFTYWESGAGLRQCPPPFSIRSRNLDPEDAKPDVSAIASSPHSSSKSASKGLPRSPPSSAARNLTARLRQRKSSHRRPKSQALMRTKQLGVSRHVYSQKADLRLLNPLESVCHSWNESELESGRRLVRFHKELRGNCLRISCEAIAQDDYSTSDIVVSCIYRADAHQFFVTSVDIIYLLEKLVDSHFEVEEKNRIRRNLEGLKPITVSKNRAGFESFFQRIMDFPDPRPRNIEKDLKVFEWSLLSTALEKIISKYSLYSDVPLQRQDTPNVCLEPAVSHHGSPQDPGTSTYLSDDTDEQKPPPCPGIEPQMSEFGYTDAVTKIEPCSDDLSFLSVESDNTVYYHSPAGQIGSMGVNDMTIVPESSANTVGWACGNDMSNLDVPPPFDVGPVTYTHDGYELTTFNSLEFQGLREHNLQSDAPEYYECFQTAP